MKMISLIGIALLAYHSLLFPDGLGLNTPVKVKDGKRFIADIIKDRSKGKKTISFNVKKNKFGVRKVSGVGESLSNCYVRIKYSYKNEQDTDQILCTPQQEFYVLAKSDWVKAYELKRGDKLQAYDGCVEVIRVEPKDESLNVCMIEVSNDHTFFVGKYEVLTHNTVFPWEVALGVSIAFGEGAAAGGTWGSSLGPIGITGGIIIGGLIGAGLNYLANTNKVHQYETFFDFGVLRDACAQNSYVI